MRFSEIVRLQFKREFNAIKANVMRDEHLSTPHPKTYSTNTNRISHALLLVLAFIYYHYLNEQ